MRNVLGIIFSFTILAFGLGACSVSGLMSNAVSAIGDASKGEPQIIVDLTAPRKFSLRGRSPHIVLTVYEPTGIKSFERSGIVVKSSNNEVSVLSGVKWSDRLPRLLQSRFMEAFENVRAVGSVSNGRDNIKSNYALRINIRSFQLNTKHKTANAHVALYVKLIHKRSGRVVGQKLFKSSHHVDIEDNIVSTTGLNDSFQTVTRRVIQWVARQNLQEDDA